MAAGWTPSLLSLENQLGTLEMSAVVWLRGVPTLDTTKIVEWMMGSWVAGGRKGSLPWSRTPQERTALQAAVQTVLQTARQAHKGEGQPLVPGVPSTPSGGGF